MNKKFYWHGKYFDNIDEFFKFINKWPHLPLDLEDFKKEMEYRIKEIELNKNMNESLTNKDAYKILRLATDWVELNE